MTKYEDLYNCFEPTIDRIKALRQQVYLANQQVGEIMYRHNTHDLPDSVEADRRELADLYAEAAAADQEARELLEEMKYEVDREYELVPFALRRQQGISRFWQLADL